MIKLLIILILLLILVLIYKSYNLENFHDKTNAVSSDKEEVIKECESCSYCDFNKNPQNKDYIISRCLLQHTQSQQEKDTYWKPVIDCKSHDKLSRDSGCKAAIKHFKANIEALKKVNNNYNKNCSCVYLIDSVSDDPRPEKVSYEKWIKTF